MNEVSSGGLRPDAVQELSAALQAQQQAGPAATDALAQGFLARVQRDIDEQVDARVRQLVVSGQVPGPSSKDLKRQQDHAREMMLGSLGIGVPLTLFAGVFGQLPGIVVVWVALIVINVAWSRGRLGG